MLCAVDGACLVMDFDGTILDTEDPVFRSWAELWAEHGQNLMRSHWQSTIGTDGVFDPLRELERRIGHPLDTASLDRRRARRDELQAAHDIRPGIVSWLEQASALRVPVGIASSSPADWVEAHLERLKLRHLFVAVVCAGGSLPPKPDPSCYRIACEQLGAQPSLSVAVEDSPNGIVAAAAAGLFIVAVPHPLTVDLDLSRAHRLLQSLEDLTLADALSAAAARQAHGSQGSSEKT